MINELKKKTEGSPPPKNSQVKDPQERIDALLQAFELFCQETSRLEEAYGKLKVEIGSINQELEETNQSLSQKLQEIGRLSHYLDSILSHISQGLLFINPQGITTTFNNAAATLLGKSKEAVVGHPYKELFEDSLFGFSLSRALRSKQAPSFVRITLPAQGEKEEKLLEIETQFLESHEANGLLITLRDTTEIRRLENLARRADRMKELGEMAALIAHEIRNPLGGIKGFASLLKRDLELQPEPQKMCDLIIEGCNNLNEKVSQILDYARPLKPQLAPLSLLVLLKEVKTLIDLDSHLNPKPTITLKVTPPDLQVTLDHTMMKGALLNLFINAVQAMPKGGNLEIEARLDKNHLLIKVTDQGVGISPENLEKLFTPYFSSKKEGNGLGLVEIQKIVQAHGGQIEVTSKLGSGTTFTLKIPQKV